jgi:hypothetical protein
MEAKVSKQKKTSSWDETFKKWIQTDPQAIVSWLSNHKATFLQVFPGELNDVNLRMDGMLLVEIDGGKCLFHIEVQTYYDPQMPKRLIRYNVEALVQYEYPVFSFCIHLLDDGEHDPPPLVVTLPNGWPVHHFNYCSIEVSQMLASDVIASGQAGILPLLPLTSGGRSHDMVEYMAEQLHQQGVYDLEVVGLAIAGLAYRKMPEDIAWIETRFNMQHNPLQDSPVWQWIKEQGREEERKEHLKDVRDLLQRCVQRLYPDLINLAELQVQQVDDPKLLKKLSAQIIDAPNEKAAQQALLAIKAAPAKRKRKPRKRKE